MSDLVMPFVTVKSVGGVHEDSAYAAGWEMAQLNERLRLLGEKRVRATIRRENAPQADLIAMRYGYTGSTHATDADEWVELRLRRLDISQKGALDDQH
jgi:hypothetical protein